MRGRDRKLAHTTIENGTQATRPSIAILAAMPHPLSPAAREEPLAVSLRP
jgi:hypothetical protein